MGQTAVMMQAIPLPRIGAMALAAGLALGFLGAGLGALRLPQGVIPAPVPPTAPEEPPAPQPELRYMSLRDPLTVAHPAGLGTIGLELGVVIEAADVNRAQLFLRDAAGAVDAPLGEALLGLIETHAGGADGWADLRAILPETMRQILNDRFEQADEGRPILEVLVIDFTAR